MCIQLQDVSCQQCKLYTIMLFLIFLTCHTPKPVGSHYLLQLEVLVWDGSSRNQPLGNTCVLNVCESHRHGGVLLCKLIHRKDASPLLHLPFLCGCTAKIQASCLIYLA